MDPNASTSYHTPPRHGRARRNAVSIVPSIPANRDSSEVDEGDDDGSHKPSPPLRLDVLICPHALMPIPIHSSGSQGSSVREDGVTNPPSYSVPLCIDLEQIPVDALQQSLSRFAFPSSSQTRRRIARRLDLEGGSSDSKSERRNFATRAWCRHCQDGDTEVCS